MTIGIASTHGGTVAVVDMQKGTRFDLSPDMADATARRCEEVAPAGDEQISALLVVEALDGRAFRYAGKRAELLKMAEDLRAAARDARRGAAAGAGESAPAATRKDLIAALRRYSDDGLPPDDLLEQIRAEFPAATMVQVRDALEAVLSDLHARAEEQDAELAAGERILAAAGDAPGNTPIVEALQHRAAAGDGEARQILDFLASPEYRAQAALMQAAVEAHPGWSTDGRSYRRTGPGPETPEALVEWFQTNHPRQAAAIEAAASEGR